VTYRRAWADRIILPIYPIWEMAPIAQSRTFADAEAGEAAAAER
jgi:hypothetical protein